MLLNGPLRRLGRPFLPWVLVGVLVSTGGVANAAPLALSEVLGSWSNERSPSDVIDGISSAASTTTWQLKTVDSEAVIWTGGNRNGSLVSDFIPSGDYLFSGQFSAVADGDNDLVGFVFGWTSHDETHFTAWGGDPADQWNGNYYLSDRSGTSYSNLLQTHSHWTATTWYDFSVERTGSTYRVTTSQGGTPIIDHSFTDTTLGSGRVGLQVYSQASYFRNLSFIPEPSTAWLLGIGLMGLAMRGRRDEPLRSDCAIVGPHDFPKRYSKQVS